MNILLFPPIAFLITFVFVYIAFKLATPSQSKISDGENNGKFEPYACGEDVSSQKAVPEYNQFFPFAIFFTLLHVAGLMIATWAFYPSAHSIASIIAYAASVLLILSILFAG